MKTRWDDNDAMGNWRTEQRDDPLTAEKFQETLCRVMEPFVVYMRDGRPFSGDWKTGLLDGGSPGKSSYPVMGFAPPQPIRTLGSTAFLADHGIRFGCLAGSMANGISSPELVIAMGKNGMLGFLGTAGQDIGDVESQVKHLLGADIPFGCNLIHSPNETGLEDALADLYIREGIHCVEASAYMNITLPLIRYRVHGIHRGSDGKIVTPNRIIAKASRVEVARRFYSPPPEKYLRILVEQRVIDSAQAELASRVPLAADLTAEADSGGHTDNRSMVTLFPIIKSIRDEMQEKYDYDTPLRIGAAGGIGSPLSAVAAFAMGASYIMMGSVLQSCRESGTSGVVREMLAESGQADIAMAPAADMFEMGVKVQVLKRGSMFAMKANKLHELYRSYTDLDHLPSPERIRLEKTIFRQPLEKIWEDTRRFFQVRDPAQIEKAARDPRHKMALVFRWYLGKASHWARTSDAPRKVDFQVWCGPSMGTFNQWVRGTFMENPGGRDAVTVAMNILWGAAVLTRKNRMAAVPMDFVLKPRTLEAINSFTGERIEH